MITPTSIELTVNFLKLIALTVAVFCLIKLSKEFYGN